MQLIVGLGNPGPRYAGTRHNAGSLVVERFAAQRGSGFTKERHALVARASGGVLLVKPTTFMNRSGTAVQAQLTRHSIRPEQLLVVHDDIDLPLGRLRVKHGGGAGGQRGVQDTIASIGPEFTRLKLGVSRPPEGWEPERWVLSRFSSEEAPLLEAVVEAACRALEIWLAEGLEAAQSWANGLDLARSHEPEAPPSEPSAAEG